MIFAYFQYLLHLRLLRGEGSKKKLKMCLHNNYMDAPKLAEIVQNLFVSALFSLFSTTYLKFSNMIVVGTQLKQKVLVKF